MSEPINNPTPAPAPEPAPEKTFTQAEVDAMIGKRLAKAMKGMPSEEELTAYRTWQTGQAGEKERWDKLTGERDTLSGKLDRRRKRAGPVETGTVRSEEGPDRRGSRVYRLQGWEDGG